MKKPSEPLTNACKSQGFAIYWHGDVESLKAVKWKNQVPLVYQLFHQEELLEWDSWSAWLTSWIRSMVMRTHIVDYARPMVSLWKHIVHSEVNFHDPTLVQLAKKYQKTPAQVLIRWSLPTGFCCVAQEWERRTVPLRTLMSLIWHSEPEHGTSLASWVEPAVYQLGPTTYQDWLSAGQKATKVVLTY